MLIFLLPILACDSSSSSRRAKHANRYRELKVGLAWTEDERNGYFLEGAQLALEEVQSVLPKGKSLKLVIKNDAGNINTGITNASQLAEDPSVIAVLGHTESYISVPASAIYEYNGIVMLNPFSTAQDLTQNNYKYLYRVIPSDENIGEEIVDYFKAQGMKKIALCYVANTYGQSFANAFERRAQAHGLDVVDRISYDIGDEAEFHRIARKWENYDFDSIMFIGSMPQGKNFYRVVEARDIKVPVVSSESMVDNAILRIDENLVDGKVFPAIFHEDSPELTTQTFVAKFKKKYNKNPDVNAAIAYDAINILAKAIVTAKSYVPTDIAKSIRRLKNYVGAVQKYNFDDRGELILKDRIGMQKVVDNNFVYIGRF